MSLLRFSAVAFLLQPTTVEELLSLDMETKKEYCWLHENTPEHIEEVIESGQPFYFQFNGDDYLIEGFFDLGYIIVEPLAYYDDGGWPEKHDFAYFGHLQAKTPEEFMALPFLDGKTMFERFEELRFFDM